jgi:hypothetical protein
MIQIKAGNRSFGDMTEHSITPADHHRLLGSLVQNSYEGSSVDASSGRVSASKENQSSALLGHPDGIALPSSCTLTPFWQSFSGMRCVTKSQAASHGCADGGV